MLGRLKLIGGSYANLEVLSTYWLVGYTILVSKQGASCCNSFLLASLLLVTTLASLTLGKLRSG